MSAAEEAIAFNTDPRIKTFTWDELVRYNIAFLKGEKRSTFYHAGPLLGDQVPEDLVNLHKLGIFTLDGQGNKVSAEFDKDSGYVLFQQRAYLDGLLPLALVEPFLKGARRDPAVVFEISHIKSKTQIYLSPELAEKWDAGNVFVVTRYREGKTKQNVKTAKWIDETGNPEPMAMLYSIENKGFENWDTWVEDGLCYFSIIEKNFAKSDISMPARILKYFEDNTTNYKVEGGARGARRTRRTRRNR